MGSGRSLLLTLFWAAAALWSQLPSVPGQFEDGCSTFPKDSERCGEPKPRFFYNTTSKSCEPFTYWGCPSNPNRYYSMEECQHHCGHIEKPGFCPVSPTGVTVECLTHCLHDGSCPGTEKCCSYGCALRCFKPITDLCQLPAEEGPCHAKIPRWFYDAKSQACKRFTFGGCLGNSNNYRKRSLCRKTCPKRDSF